MREGDVSLQARAEWKWNLSVIVKSHDIAVQIAGRCPFLNKQKTLKFSFFLWSMFFHLVSSRMHSLIQFSNTLYRSLSDWSIVWKVELVLHHFLEKSLHYCSQFVVILAYIDKNFKCFAIIWGFIWYKTSNSSCQECREGSVQFICIYGAIPYFHGCAMRSIWECFQSNLWNGK